MANPLFSWDQTDGILEVIGRSLYGAILGPFMAPANFGIIYFDKATNRFMASENGGSPVNLLTGGGGGSAYTNVQNQGAPLPQETTINVVGSALVASDNPGVATNITLSQSPVGSASVVGTGRLMNTTAPLQGGGDLSADRTLSITQAGTASNGYLSSTDWNTFNNKGGISGAGTSGQVTYWSGSSAITGDANFLWNSASQLFTINGSFDQVGIAAPVLSAANNVRVYLDSTSHLWKASVNGGAYVNILQGSAGSSAYQTVETNGTALAQEPTLNLIGNAISAVDNPGSSRTDVTINQSPAGSASLVGTGRNINTSTGLSGGGSLASDLTLSVVANSVVEKINVDNNGALVGTRHEVNFIPGTNVTLTVSDNNVSDRVDVTINSTASGGVTGSYAASIMNTPQNIATTVQDYIVFGTGSFDTAGFYNGANPTRLTAPATGAYEVFVNLVYAPLSGSGTVICQVVVNHNSAALLNGIKWENVEGPVGPNSTINYSGIGQLNSGDFIEVYVNNAASGTIQFMNGSFSIVRIA